MFKIIYSKLTVSDPGFLFRPPFVSRKKVMSDPQEMAKSMTELDWSPMTKLVFNFFDESLNSDPKVIKS